MPRRTWPRACSPRPEVEADQLVAATRAALAADGDLLRRRRGARSRMRSPSSLGQRDGGDATALAAAIAALNRATGEFAALRMDRGVARALTGRNIDALT